MLICINCGNKHNFKYVRDVEDKRGEYQDILCLDCDKSNVVEIDDLLTDIILLLNNNGIKTLYSCEGHYNAKVIGSFVGGYISIHDENRDVLNRLSDIPDNIADFIITYEEVVGPKSAKDLTYINKVVLRFQSNGQFENNYVYTIKKVNFYMELNKRLEKILEKK